MIDKSGVCWRIVDDSEGVDNKNMWLTWKRNNQTSHDNTAAVVLLLNTMLLSWHFLPFFHKNPKASLLANTSRGSRCVWYFNVDIF